MKLMMMIMMSLFNVNSILLQSGNINFIPSSFRAKIISPHTENIYHAIIKLPNNDYVKIMYERVGIFKYRIQMSGKIKVRGSIYYDDENNCFIEDHILDALHKYRRTSYVPWYDNEIDTIEADVLLEIFTHIKRIFKYELYLRV